MSATQAGRTVDLRHDDRDGTDHPGNGHHPDRPSDIGTRGWWEILKRVKTALKEEQVSLLAAGVAFFALIAMVPAFIALVSLYGLLADPGDVQRQVADLTQAMPTEARDLIEQQLESIVSTSSSSLGTGLVIGLALALWSASSGMRSLMSGIGVVYKEGDGRGFLKIRLLSLLLTLGAVVFVVGAFFVVAFLPSLLADTGMGTAGRVAVSILRWPLLGLGMLAGLAVLYRYAPDRADAELRWITPGSLIAIGLWLAGSIGFSVYTANFGSYNETYGSLGAVVILLLWLYLSAFVILLAGEINAQLELQTDADTTTGPDKPMGQRGATVADEVVPLEG